MRASAVFALSLLTFAAVPTMAQQTATSQVEEATVQETIRLTKQKPDFMMKFLSMTPTEENIQGDTCANSALLPPGINRILASMADNSLIVSGTPAAVEALKRGVRVADVEMSHPAKNHTTLVLTPTRLQPRFLREQLLKLPEDGKASVRGERLRLEGTAAWVDRALRMVVRSEMAEQ